MEQQLSTDSLTNSEVFDLVSDRVGRSASKFIASHVPDLTRNDIILLQASSRFNLLSQPRKEYAAIINLAKLNNVRFVNKYLEVCNHKLTFGAILVGRVETIGERKRRVYGRLKRPLSDMYYFMDFLFHRVCPKVKGFKWFYFAITKGKRRVVSRTEVLGRIVSCGFEIVEECEVDNIMYFAVRKVTTPSMEENPSYGPLFGMRRIGKGGKEIVVYKLRTMHPFSEFLQDYVYRLNSLEEGGKFKDDFRISTLGKLFRRFWIDELPMIFNLLKGDMKLVGVRPLSRHYLSLYTPDLQELRKSVKPGLIPPFYADLPKTLEEIQESERKYIVAYRKSPLTTDVKYLSKALYNIVIKRARSN